MLAKQAGEDGDDEDWENDDAEETALEGYSTAVDDEDNLVDEYQIFKAIIQSKTAHGHEVALQSMSADHLSHPTLVQTSRLETPRGTRH